MDSFGFEFGAIGELLLSPSTGSEKTKFMKGIIKSWLKSRYWGRAMVLSDTLDLPQPDSLAKWRMLPSEVAQFFKLLFVLHQTNAVFISSRLDVAVGEQALTSKRGPSDWLAGRINRALSEIQVPTDFVAFSIEFAPKQAKTLHRLHIHGCCCIPEEKRKQAEDVLKKLLAPDYKTHGKNVAVKIERPRKNTDVARYAPKEAAITELRIRKARGCKLGSSAHRASARATRGGQEAYEMMNKFLHGNPYNYAGLTDFS